MHKLCDIAEIRCVERPRGNRGCPTQVLPSLAQSLVSRITEADSRYTSLILLSVAWTTYNPGNLNGPSHKRGGTCHVPIVAGWKPPSSSSSRRRVRTTRYESAACDFSLGQILYESGGPLG